MTAVGIVLGRRLCLPTVRRRLRGEGAGIHFGPFFLSNVVAVGPFDHCSRTTGGPPSSHRRFIPWPMAGGRPSWVMGTIGRNGRRPLEGLWRSHFPSGRHPGPLAVREVPLEAGKGRLLARLGRRAAPVRLRSRLQSPRPLGIDRRGDFPEFELGIQIVERFAPKSHSRALVRRHYSERQLLESCFDTGPRSMSLWARAEESRLVCSSVAGGGRQ